MEIKDNSKLNESPTSLVKAIARLTTSLSYKFQMATAHDRTILAAAINILTQAMVTSQFSSADAQRLYTAALKVSTLSGKDK